MHTLHIYRGLQNSSHFLNARNAAVQLWLKIMQTGYPSVKACPRIMCGPLQNVCLPLRYRVASIFKSSLFNTASFYKYAYSGQAALSMKRGLAISVSTSFADSFCRQLQPSDLLNKSTFEYSVKWRWHMNLQTCRAPGMPCDLPRKGCCVDAPAIEVETAEHLVLSQESRSTSTQNPHCSYDQLSTDQQKPSGRYPQTDWKWPSPLSE